MIGSVEVTLQFILTDQFNMNRDALLDKAA